MSFSTVPLGAAGGLERPIRDVMHAGHVTIPATAPLSVAARAMANEKVHAVLVRDEHGEPLGWVTTRGMLHNVARDWSSATAREAITEHIVSVAPDATIRAGLEAFLASSASHILVRAEDELVLGVVAESDLLTLIAGGLP